MPRIYVKSNAYILQKFDKNYSIPVGVTALGKFRGKADDEVPPLATNNTDEIEPLYNAKKKKDGKTKY